VAKKRTTKKLAQKTTRNNNLDHFASQIKLGESYTSLLLGAIVVVVGLILVLTLLKHRTSLTQQTGSSSTINNEQNAKNRSYTVKSGDDLWHIAQSTYGSGYNWTDIAQANSLSTPSVLYTGTKLTIPNVKPKEKTSDTVNTQVQNKITGTSYTVVEGDYLWDIAVRAYGDGFKWTDIAKANNIANPDIIYSGTNLKLPR
jgi:nucleoid-associated protein YgaU